MLKDHKCRMLLTAFGGLAMLAGGGTASAAMAAEFRAVLTGDNELATGDADGWGRAAVDLRRGHVADAAHLEIGAEPAT